MFPKNSVENVENQILTILEEVGNKMNPTIERFLLQGEADRSLLQYLDDNLVFMKSRLVPVSVANK